MNREYHSWHSPSLNRTMELLVFGHGGARVLVFPTSMGRFYEWEDRGMMGALQEHIERGWIQLYCVDSVDAESWYARWKDPGARAWRHMEYENYLLHEVLPMMSSKNPTPYLITTGASFGAYHAMNFALRHPDITNRVIAMSGLYDIERWVGNYRDDNIYYNCPCLYIPNEYDESRLNLLRQLDIIIAIGRDDSNIGNNRWLSGALWGKGIGNALREWDGWAHDWPWWLKMIQLYIGGHDDDGAGGVMLKVGVIVGREWSWPPAFIEEVNKREEGVTAEYAQLGGTRMNEPSPYAVLVDRISHEVPYYRSYLKNAMLQGSYVINNPFMWTADDKFFGASLITKLGIASPKTVVLPNKEYVPGIVHNESLRNLLYPIPWEEHIEYLGGFPVVLKDAHGGGWKQVHICHSMRDLWDSYNQSGLLTMVLQEFIKWDDNQYLRCMCLGQQDIKVMKYDPDQRRYLPPDLTSDLYARVVADSLQIVRAFGYDMNTIEWAIRDGVPYAIDFMNPAPDMDINTTGVEYHRWCVEKMADLCIHLAKNPKPQVAEVKWSTMFNG